MPKSSLPIQSLKICDSLNLSLTLPEVAQQYAVHDKDTTTRHKITALAKETTELNWNKFVLSIREHGILEPLLVYLEGKQHRIADGRHRWLAAKAIGLETVPVEIVSREAAAVRAETSVQAKRDLPAGYRAYMAVIWHPEVAAKALGGSKLFLGIKSDPNGLISLTKPMTQEELGAAYGVSQKLISQAVQCYIETHDDPDLRKMHLAKLSGGYGLGALNAAAAALDKDNQTKEASPSSIKTNIGAFATGMNKWVTWDKATKLKTLSLITAQVERMEVEAVDALLKAVQDARPTAVKLKEEKAKAPAARLSKKAVKAFAAAH